MKNFPFFRRSDYEAGGLLEYLMVGFGRFITSFPNPLGRYFLRGWAEEDAREARHEAEMKAFTEASRTRYLEAVLSDDHGQPQTKH